MTELINIKKQHFYSATIDEVLEGDFNKKSLIIIVDNSHLEELISKCDAVIEKNVSQLIILSDSVGSALAQLNGKKNLLLAACTLKEAVRLAVSDFEEDNEIICVLNEGENEVKNIVELLMV